jgi:sigma-E factor negative regulatory protein RseC
MIEETAQVKAIHGDFALIEVLRQGGCNGCSLAAGCGTGSLGRLLGRRQKPFSIVNSLNLGPGDRVILGVAENAYVSVGLLVYILPLISMFLFSIVADTLFGSAELINVIGAITGLVGGLLLSAKLSKLPCFKSIQPQIIRQIW